MNRDMCPENIKAGGGSRQGEGLGSRMSSNLDDVVICMSWTEACGSFPK